MPHIEEATLTSILKEKRDQGERLAHLRRAVMVLGIIMAIQMAAIGTLFFMRHESRQDYVSRSDIQEMVRDQLMETIDAEIKSREKRQVKDVQPKGTLTLHDNEGRPSIIISAENHAIEILDEDGQIRVVLGRAFLTDKQLGGRSETPEGLVVFRKDGTVVRKFP